jgi:3-oxoacyl-[acyl-carrier protein] reductase
MVEWYHNAHFVSSVKNTRTKIMIDTGLKDKVVLVTGGNNPFGIGAATAKGFAAEGAKVFINYLRKSPEPYGVSQDEVERATGPSYPFYLGQGGKQPDEVLQSIREKGGQVEAWEGDLSEPNTIPELFDRAETTFGRIDILVNNAGHALPDDTTFTITTKIFDQTFAVNTRATVLMIAEFVRRFKARDGQDGRIINISTDSAQCFATQIAYGASKAAIEAFTRSIACEVGPCGITVNTIAPGPIQTSYLPEERVVEVKTQIPLGRIGTPKDIANAVIFLASEQASWITGRVLRVDGGHIPFS